MTSATFAIDVGGTFTDCVGTAADGRELRLKVLSSGVFKGIAGPETGPARLIDPARRLDPKGFWDGCPIRFQDSAGAVIAAAVVSHVDPSTGEIFPRGDWPIPPAPGLRYELAPPWEAPVSAVRYLLRLAAADRLPPLSIRLGTTRGTNALLTRTGAAVAFAVTAGFADILRIGHQNRPDLFALDIVKPPVLFESALEIDERTAADGTVLKAPDESTVRAQLRAERSRGTTALAICFLHGALHPAHERLVAAWARAEGFTEVTLGHEVSAIPKLISRGDTAVLDAYLSPLLREYVARLHTQFGGADLEPVRKASATSAGLVRTEFFVGLSDEYRPNSPTSASSNRSEPLRLGARRYFPDRLLRLMTSAGGLVAAGEFRGKDSILSGPAGGAVGTARIAARAGFRRAIGFDMGGTSTDVARCDGTVGLETETEKAGVRIAVPTVAVRTVAAGGGSICDFDGTRFRVGPQSAGADPGPACYGRGGPLTVTDVNLFLGRILASRFPFPLDEAAVRDRLETLRCRVESALGQPWSLEEIALGLIRVADAEMVRPIRGISVAQGADPRDYVLVPFGGAAGQHACSIARELGMSRILLHADAGLLSAVGIGLADVSRIVARPLCEPDGPALRGKLSALFADLTAAALAALTAEGFGADRCNVLKSIDLRYAGLEGFLTVDLPDGASSEPFDHAAAYEAEHERRYGYRRPGRTIEAVLARVTAVGQGSSPPPRRVPSTTRTPVAALRQKVRFAGGLQEVPVFDRADLQPGDTFPGPAIVCEAGSTAVVEPGWNASVPAVGELLLTRAEVSDATSSNASPYATSPDPAGPADPVLLEVFLHRFAGIAERMGETLRNTSSSVNVKERLDFSCAIFSPRGELVVNAPHIPVHLGAMGATVRALLERVPQPLPGDVFATNDPYAGGSHLPDVTVITPVHDPADGTLLFFTACRAHHAELGGIVPGSMPPFSRNLAEEGILLPFLKVVEGGASRLDRVETLLRGGPYPSRAPADNLADLEAQIAANRHGENELRQLLNEVGRPLVLAYMTHIRTAARLALENSLARLPEGSREFADRLDDGTPIRVRVERTGKRLTIDFTGSGPVSPGNLNANRAIVSAAVLYCLRLWMRADVPLNEGVLEPVDLILPTPSLLSPLPGPDPEHSPAVVGGNVETSQRVVDVLLGALGLAAASQGTMNNLTCGDGTFGYYETICGGAGATATAPGADAVHTHMTNTRLTDPEVFERRFPVRVRRFAVRRGSGGAGQHRGGDGVIREIEFLRPVTVALISQRRGENVPYGLAGGGPGMAGENAILLPDGTLEPLPGSFRRDVPAGTVLRILTPGGGGWGAADANG